MMGAQRYSVIPVFFILLVTTVLAVPDFSTLENHQVAVTDIFIASNNLDCQTTFPVMIELKNTGEHEEDVTIELRTNNGEIEELTQLHNLKPDRIEIITLTASFNQQPKGHLEFEVIASYTGKTTHFFKPFTFSCTDIKPPVTFIKSSSNRAPQEPIQQPEQRSLVISTMTAVTIGLGAVLVLLIVLYLIKLYAEK